MKKANDLLYASNFQEAIQEYDKILNSNPEKDTILAANYNKAQAYDGLGQYSAAASCYQKIIQIDPKFSNGQVYYEHGQVLQLAKMYNQCKEAYRKYLNFCPKHSECHFNLGQVLTSLGELQDAIKSFEKAAQFKPNYTKAYLSKIAILKRLKRYDQILKVCSKALSVQPTDFQILYEQGLAFNNLQKHKQGIQSLNECIKYNKRYVRAYIVLADCYYKSQKDQLGLETLNKCLQSNSDVIKTVEKKEIKILMGTIYMNSKQYKNAIDCFKQVLSQRPIIEHVKGKVAVCLQEYGNTFFNDQSYNDALVCYNQALKYENRVSSINNSGLAYFSMNKFKQAQKCFNDVLAKQPKNVNALNNLAALYRKNGNSEKSIKILEDLAMKNPNNPEVHINNGKNYLILHKYNEAYVEFSKALQMSPDQLNYNLMNDFSVTLQKLQRYEQALSYANKANDLTNNKSPLFLLNRASILMSLDKIAQAKLDFDKAAAQLRVPDKEFLQKLGINVGNLKYIFNQLNHYAYLMQPINDLRKQIQRQVEEMPIKDEVKFNKVVQKVEKAEQYAMSRIITQINKQNPQQNPNPEESRQDYNTIKKFIEQAKQIMQSQRKQIQMLKSQINLLKIDSQQIKQKLKYLPQSASLKKKLDQLYAQQDVQIWLYGKQLYWILNGYLKGYMLIATGVVSKGENIDRGKFNQAIKSVGGILQYANNIPLIGEFSELISKICGFFVDLEDDVIIEKMYEVISYNYDLEEDLNNEICQAVLVILNSPYKISKIRENLSFNPSKSFFSKIKEKMQDISDWFSQKKNEFIMHLRGYEKLSKIAQHQLALVDAGAMISIILNTSSIPTGKLRPIFNAAKKLGYGDQLQQMIYEAYQRENEEIRVSNHSYCVIMRCQIVYDNPALNNRKFVEFLKDQKGYNDLMSKTLNLSPQYFGIVQDLLVCEYYSVVIDLVLKQTFR